ncbi:hypothetical protein EK21DRAFT_86395 [Setomelanomma holmii]|uniref:Uncharacterized protein n=1 Tax=Setomelanomma holmii TaxID=210430 RepID=A0A9P4HEZ6_9PLEO|nr:hypothetical protein EK21DRAFT_86395 [Setomelanomma holmii]
MTAPPSTIHVLDKANYSKHRLVDIPETQLPPLGPSSLRLQSKILGLTTNNLTYARLGHLMGWYDIFPLPPNTPEPYNDSQIYGRVAAWGYAEVVESTVPDIATGLTVYGYHPISTGIETVRIEFAEHDGKRIANQIIVLDEHRQHLWKIYNRLQICAPLDELGRTKGIDSLGWDSLMQGLFGTSYNLSTYAFAWNDQNRLHPGGKGEWTAQDADLRNATVVMLNASGKTGLSFAYCLRQNRPKEHQPLTIIGVGSPASVSVIQQSGLYDKVVLNSEHEATKAYIESTSGTRIVLLDFGAREGAAETWRNVLSTSHIPFQLVTIGGEVKVQDPEAARKRLASLQTLNIVHASLLREKGIEIGGEKYFDEFYKAFDEFKGKVRGMRLVWGEGLEGWRDGWEAFCRDEIRANTGLVYRVSHVLGKNLGLPEAK